MQEKLRVSGVLPGTATGNDGSERNYKSGAHERVEQRKQGNRFKREIRVWAEEGEKGGKKIKV